MQKLLLTTQTKTALINMTPMIQKALSDQDFRSGIVVVYSPHTTAGLTVNENADPDVCRDMTTFLNKLVPASFPFRHAEGNSDAHIKGSLMNFSQTFIVEDGRLQLGTWQGIYLMEFDGPRQRQVWIKCLPDSTAP